MTCKTNQVRALCRPGAALAALAVLLALPASQSARAEQRDTAQRSAMRRCSPRWQTGSAEKRNKMDLLPLETQVLGQSRWLAGGPAALRVIVSDHRSGKAIPAHVTLTLSAKGAGAEAGRFRSQTLYSGKTTAAGTLDAGFTVPKETTGPCTLVVSVQSALGADTVAQDIQVTEAVQAMLTADKPLYQPGQTMHMRVLVLDQGSRQAVRALPVTFEVEDARGNKVFKQKARLSEFGIASADFQLADEVNMGTFTLRTVLPTGETEKKVRVDRYVLPRFKISMTPERTFYLPGETVKGTLQANYFFGKPVADGRASIDINTIDIGVTRLGHVEGRTDASGKYAFEYTLPTSFVGQPFEQGKAVAEFHATLKDTADHKQEAHVSVPVVREPILIALVPESRNLTPGIQNRIFIATASPDGTPLKQARISVSSGAAQSQLTADDLGIAVYAFTPGKESVTVKVTAADSRGRTARAQHVYGPASRKEGIILRVDKPLPKVGDRLNLQTLCSIRGGTLYLDVIRNRQTILTRAENMANGTATYTLPVTDDMVGTIEIHAYKILPDEEIIRDTRTVVVSPADDLNVSVTADRGQYRPGGEALLKFAVQDAHRQPVRAALGLAMVDESVFALSELQPGLEKIYYLLEKELMEPKYEIHGLRSSGLLRGPREPAALTAQDVVRQRAASLLFALMPARSEFDFHHNTYAARWEKLKAEVLVEMQGALNKIAHAIARYREETRSDISAEKGLDLLIDKGYLKSSDLLDRWGNRYRFDLHGSKTYSGYFTLSSAGPDGRWDTVDDLQGINNYGMTGPWGGRGFGGGRALMLRDGDPMGFKAQNGPGDILRMAAPAATGMLKEARSRVIDAGAASARQGGGGSAAGAEPVRVRSYFPETMYWNPALITDDSGHAELRLPMADSITTWRLSMMANSTKGRLGSATAPIKVFQDFFVELDLPVSLTQNDRVDIPVAVYNYLPGPQEITLTLQQEPWFSLRGEAIQKHSIDAGQVKVVYYPVTIKAIGRHTLSVTARGSRLSDAMRRDIDVLPDGKEFAQVINDRLEGRVEKSLAFPPTAIAGASSLWVKLYPGAFSQVLEGVDGVLRMPNGCFEQTSSTTYPNVLVLDYLKQTKRINPEIRMKAEGFINIGYQRLVTFECKSGGFSWFGNEPAHQILTAYGLLEFSDMAKVHEVDPNLIARTQTWLAGKQRPDGSWEETGQGIAEGIINRQTGALRTTAYVVWALAESGYQGPQIAHGVEYARAHWREAKDPYSLAILLNLFARVERDAETTAQVAGSLIELARTTEKTAWWTGQTQTFTGARDQGADLETTGLAAHGFVRWGHNAGFTNRVLTYLVQNKDSFGTWHSTQGTVWSMKSLLLAAQSGVGGGKGTVKILANGSELATFSITPDDSDVMRQTSLDRLLRQDENKVTLVYEGEGSLLYQLVARHYTPWSEVGPPPAAFEPLELKVAYDKRTLQQDDTAAVTVTIHNRTDRVAEMPLIDVGVPPGFTVIPDALQAAVDRKAISKFTVAARQVILYLEKLEPGETKTLTYQVRAKFPVKARTPLSRAYPYYNPERATTSAPQDIVVTQ